MEFIKSAFIKPQMARRTAMVLIAQFIMGFAVALLKLTLLGTDPYAAMMMGLTALTPLSYGAFCAIGNCFFFMFEILLGRQYIGLGTIANWFLLGYCVMFWNWVIGMIVPAGLSSFGVKLAVCIVAIVILAFSLSLYQSADYGSSPYDCLPLIIRDRLHIPFFAARVGLDACAVLVCVAVHGVVGLGTLLIVIGLGTIADFFNRNVCGKMIA